MRAQLSCKVDETLRCCWDSARTTPLAARERKAADNRGGTLTMVQTEENENNSGEWGFLALIRGASVADLRRSENERPTLFDVPGTLQIHDIGM